MDDRLDKFIELLQRYVLLQGCEPHIVAAIALAKTSLEQYDKDQIEIEAQTMNDVVGNYGSDDNV